ncbi:MAG: tRNA (N(6)-L-threonylcarbamoyladenosine(37)-C(2))-methylthiotransferase MtaB [Tissierellia bacterium]|nr:tRNA (N(6)-L-threonylcarbamoyladenosine(37)-C(2))-methylthiotransferase MtaB [Tissierellia bacterium]
MKKFNIETLGCKVNQYESEALERLFEESGYEKAQKGDKADVYVINTCTVTGQAAAKSRQYINRAKRDNPEAQIAVVGCYSQVSPEEIEKLGVDVIIGTKDRARVLELLDQARQLKTSISIVENIKRNQKFDELKYNTQRDMTRAYLKIQEGCNMYCSYCIIPYARGPISSRDMDNILEESRKLAAAGFKEIVLTGIHVESYGKDLGKDYFRLIDVVEKVAEIEGVERIRLSSVEPRIISDEFMERYVASKKACDHFHLSLQSGSDAILKAMNRKYDTSQYLEKVNLIRKYMPDAGITTDIIVGFPGETQELFDETMGFVDKIAFSKIHVFPYSKRKATPAADFEMQVEGPIKKQRAHLLAEKEEKISKAFLDSFIGKTLKVLFEEEAARDVVTEGYSTNYLRVSVPRDDSLINQIRNVKIIERKDLTLKGVVL